MKTYDIQLEKAKALASIAERARKQDRYKKYRKVTLSILFVLFLFCSVCSYRVRDGQAGFVLSQFKTTIGGFVPVKKVGRPRVPKVLTEKDQRVLDLLDVIACMSLMPADQRTRREQAVVEEAIKLQRFLNSIGVHRGTVN